MIRNPIGLVHCKGGLATYGSFTAGKVYAYHLSNIDFNERYWVYSRNTYHVFTPVSFSTYFEVKP